jgi:hypothetical protein
MELDLVDAMPEAIVSAQDRRVGVGEASPRQCVATGLDAEPPETLACPRGAFALDRFEQHAVAGENVVALERWRLVQHLVGRWHGDETTKASGVAETGRVGCRAETRKGPRDAREPFRSWNAMRRS